MAARQIIEDLSDELGVNWNEDSIIEILCEYIDKQMSDDAFEDFVRQRAEGELGEEEDDLPDSSRNY